MKKFFAVIVLMMLVTSGAWAGTNTSNEVLLNVNGLPVATINAAATDEAYVGDLVTPFQLDVTFPGTSTLPNPTFAWTVPVGITLSDATMQNPTIDVTGSLAGVYVLSCLVTNDAGPMTSNTVTLTLYDIPTVMLTSVPIAAPVAPLDGVAEANSGATTVLTATGAGGWGIAPSLTIVIEISLDGGLTWNPVIDDGLAHIINSILGVTTFTINPTSVPDAAIYHATVDDGSGVPIP